MDERDHEQAPEQETQEEIHEQARDEGDDPVTRREELELDLMDEDASEAGTRIGEHNP